MYTTKRVPNCASYRALNEDALPAHRQNHESDCKSCVFYSSRNCGVEIADSIEPMMELLS